jgi:hypothetical protein
MDMHKSGKLQAMHRSLRPFVCCENVRTHTFRMRSNGGRGGGRANQAKLWRAACYCTVFVCACRSGPRHMQACQEYKAANRTTQSRGRGVPRQPRVRFVWYTM